MFRPDVEGLRGLAVLAVVLFHFDFTFLSGGFLGVDIFFVVSGYVISKGMSARIQKGQFSFLDFFGRRVRRILPALAAVIVAVLFAGYFLLSVPSFQDLGLTATYSALSVSNFYFAGSVGYFDPAAIQKPLLHMWSLSVEEQFYLIWPIVFVLLHTYIKPHHRIKVLIVAILLGVVVSELWVRENETYAFFMAPSRFFEFMLGALVVLVEKKEFPLSQRHFSAMFVVGFLVTISCLLLYKESLAFPGLMGVAPAVSAALLLYAGSKTNLSFIFSNVFMRFFGKISYSLYLVHWPLVVFYKYITGGDLWLHEQMALIVLSVASAFFLWRYIEQPFRKNNDNAYLVSTHIFYSGLGVIFSLILISAQIFYLSKGAPWRLSAESKTVYKNYQEQLFKRRCASTENLPENFTCFFGDVDQKHESLILIGDSHANNFRSSLSVLLDETNLKAIHRLTPGCPPIRGASVIHEANSNWYRLCKRRMKSMFKYARNDHIDTVILSGRWSLYTRNTRLGETGNRGRVYLGIGENDERSSERSKKIFSVKMRKTIVDLLEHNKKVIVFGQAPNMGIDMKKCLYKPDSLYFEFSDCVVESDKDALENIQFTNNVLKKIAESYTDQVLFIDAGKALCEGACLYLEDDVPLYLDSNHLLPSGGWKIVERYASEIKSFIAKQ